MKRLFTLILAFLVLTILPQYVAAQTTPSSGEVKMESKQSKQKAKKAKKEEKKAKKKSKKMTDSETQALPEKGEQPVKGEQAVTKEGEVKTKKNEPRPYVSKPVEKPKKEPKEQQKLAKPKDQ